MGKFEFNLPDAFMDELAKLQDIDDVAVEMIDAGLPIVKKELQRNLISHRQSGDLIDSISISSAKPVKTGGFFGKIYPKGYDSKGVANAIKLACLNFGVSGKNGYWKQKPEPIITTTIKNSEDAVVNEMQEVFLNEVGFR